jgi:general stress protein 26
MNKLKLSDISSKMRSIDICMMTSIGNYGRLISRPMSNNGDVEYDGNSYFFTYSDSEIVKDVKKNNNVNLGYQGSDMFYISIIGKAVLIKDKEILATHWVKSLEQWFKEGIDTPGIIMLHVKAVTIKYWHKEQQGEIDL